LKKSLRAIRRFVLIPIIREKSHHITVVARLAVLGLAGARDDSEGWADEASARLMMKTRRGAA
jgi:hypothetical protein